MGRHPHEHEGVGRRGPRSRPPLSRPGDGLGGGGQGTAATATLRFYSEGGRARELRGGGDRARPPGNWAPVLLQGCARPSSLVT